MFSSRYRSFHEVFSDFACRFVSFGHFLGAVGYLWDLIFSRSLKKCPRTDFTQAFGSNFVTLFALFPDPSRARAGNVENWGLPLLNHLWTLASIYIYIYIYIYIWKNPTAPACQSHQLAPVTDYLLLIFPVLFCLADCWSSSCPAVIADSWSANANKW